MKLEICLKPLEAYFWGNDRNLKYVSDGYDGKDYKAASYYTVSEKTPSQTALFGILRYTGIQRVSTDFTLMEQDVENIGKRSFHLLGGTGQHFGRIHSISPLFLKNGRGEYFVRAPFDHDMNDRGVYEPFSQKDYEEVLTSEGMKYLPIAHDAKAGCAEGYVNLTTGQYVPDRDIFQEEEQVGIRRRKAHESAEDSEQGYFKMLRYHMKEHSFCFFADVAADFYHTQQTVVFGGYGRSAFEVSITKDATLPSLRLLDRASAVAGTRRAVAISDVFLDEDDKLQALYGQCAYANTRTKEYRVFLTNYGAGRKQGQRFYRRDENIRLIQAGSVFLVRDQTGFLAQVENETARTVGFNHFLIGGEWK